MIRTWFLDEPHAPGMPGLADARAADRPHWVEVVEPDDAERAAIATRYGLHEVTVTAALREGQPPRLFEGDTHVGLVTQTPLATTGTGFRKIGIVFAERWVITLLRKPLAPLQHMLQHERGRPRERPLQPSDLVHAVLDRATLGFEGLADAHLDRSSALERVLDARDDGSFLKELLTQRQELVRLTRSLRRQRDMLLALARHEHPVLTSQVRPYLRDVSDHMTRVVEIAEAAREGMLALRDTHLSLVNNRLGETMRVLTVIATIMMPLSLVAGIFGMNLPGIPGSDSPFAIWAVLAGMAALAAVMVSWFRRRHWV